MAGYIGSVGLTGYIAPADVLDTYALQDEIFNRGGYRSVSDLSERDNISIDRRKLGMLVFCFSDNNYYTLKNSLNNSDWEIAELGGSAFTGELINDSVTTLYDLKNTDKVVNVKAFNNSGLEINIDNNSNFKDGYQCIIINDWRTGNTGVSVFSIHGYNGVSFRTFLNVGTNIFNINKGVAFILSYVGGQWFLNQIDKTLIEVNNKWNIEYGQTVLSPQQLSEDIGHYILPANTVPSGLGVAEYILPDASYNQEGQIVFLRHANSDGLIEMEDVKISVLSGTIKDSKGQAHGDILLKSGEVAILYCAYDDPQEWIIYGFLNRGGNETFIDVTSNYTTSDGGNYFVYGEDILFSINPSVENFRTFTIKSVTGSCIIESNTGIIDGITQDITINEGSCITIVSKNGEYFITNLY